MATETMAHPTDVCNRADELARRAAAMAWMLAASDENQMPDGTAQRVGEQLAEMIQELGRCAGQLFEAYREAHGLPPTPERGA